MFAAVCFANTMCIIELETNMPPAGKAIIQRIALSAKASPANEPGAEIPNIASSQAVKRVAGKNRTIISVT